MSVQNIVIGTPQCQCKQLHASLHMCTGGQLIEAGEPEGQAFQTKMDELLTKWDSLQDSVENRRNNLELSEIAQQVRSDYLLVMCSIRV